MLTFPAVYGNKKLDRALHKSSNGLVQARHNYVLFLTSRNHPILQSNKNNKLVLNFQNSVGCFSLGARGGPHRARMSIWLAASPLFSISLLVGSYETDQL